MYMQIEFDFRCLVQERAPSANSVNNARCDTGSLARWRHFSSHHAGGVAEFCKNFLSAAVALFVAPLAALITSFTSVATAELNASSVAASPSLRHTPAEVRNVEGSRFSSVQVASPESTGVKTARIDAVLSSVPPTQTRLRESDSCHGSSPAPQTQATTASATLLRSPDGDSMSMTQQRDPSLLHQPALHYTGQAPSESPTVQSTSAATRSCGVLQLAGPAPAEARAAARPAETIQAASDGRDRVQDVLRTLDNQLDNALSGAQGAALRSLPASGTVDPAAALQARELVLEAVELVEQARLSMHSTMCAMRLTPNCICMWTVGLYVQSW